MASDPLIHRHPHTVPEPSPASGAATSGRAEESHQAAPARHGALVQAFRLAQLVLYFIVAAISIHITQLLAAPLYFIDRNWYYAFMALTKQHFGLLVVTLTQWGSPTLVRVSGDKSVRGQLRQTKDGRLECSFPERLVMLSNHQIYTDWLYLWWTAYTNRMHGHLYIILKESLKYIPLLGPGMMFFGFIFLSRKWAKDQPRFKHRLQKLSSRHSGPMSGSQSLDPMWLLLFPEGTNVSENGRASSKKWADKAGIEDLNHVLLPRSTGLLFCLRELKNTVDWVYDCTVAYEGIPRGGFGQDFFTLKSIYIQGCPPPKSVNMYWRRFAVSSMPLDDTKAFEAWLDERWREKDKLLEHYMQNGRFPADEALAVDKDYHYSVHEDGSTDGNAVQAAGYIETEVKPTSRFEILQIFVPGAAALLILNVAFKMWSLVLHGTFRAPT